MLNALPSHSCPTLGCSQTTELLKVLETASSSRPTANEVAFTCGQCGAESAIWVWEGKVRIAAKGLTIEIPALHVYVDPTYGIDCILQGRLYHMPKRRETG